MSREEQFWAKVDRSAGPCWPWLARLGRDGYGQTKWGGKNVRAHRLAWELTFGPIPEGKFILHARGCNNPACVNPAHLRVGTHAENMEDRNAQGRQSKGNAHADTMRRVASRGDANGLRLHPERAARGETNGNAKLVAANIPVIDARIAAGETQAFIAADYGVAHTLIGKIARREIWKHIPKEKS